MIAGSTYIGNGTTQGFRVVRTSDAKRGYALLARDDGRWTVIEYDRPGGQVYSAMPGDMPTGGGRWMSRMSPSGVAYVSHGYSASYARAVYRRLTQ